MRRRNILLLIILAIFAFSLWAVIPLDGNRFGRQGVRLGLDLVGGVHLVYQVKFPDNATDAEKNAAIDREIATIQSRIDQYGVVDPIIQKLGNDRILVQLPGFTDIDAAKGFVETTGFLEFRQMELTADGKQVTLGDYLSQAKPAFVDTKETGTRIFVDTKNNPVVIITSTPAGLKFTDNNGKVIDPAAMDFYRTSVSWVISRGDDGTPLTGGLLADARADVQTQAGVNAVVDIKWNDQGSAIFDQIAKRLYQKQLGIFLDSKLISAPRINSQSYGGSAIIEGSFSVDEVKKLANLLQSGSLPVPLVKPPLYQEKVSATLGANFVDNSVKAGIIGILLVMLFMIAYYRMSGVVASLALLFYSAVVLAIFKLWPITLNLAGLGGFIVSVGMAVDANVLIFERMKEEFRSGRTLGAAIDAGFDRAWSAIRDSNVTTFIACAILYWLGSSVVASGPVMSFAITLFIGVAVSMFSAITVSRVLLQLFQGTALAQKTNWFAPNWGKK